MLIWANSFAAMAAISLFFFSFSISSSTCCSAACFAASPSAFASACSLRMRASTWAICSFISFSVLRAIRTRSSVSAFSLSSALWMASITCECQIFSSRLIRSFLAAFSATCCWRSSRTCDRNIFELKFLMRSSCSYRIRLARSMAAPLFFSWKAASSSSSLFRASSWASIRAWRSASFLIRSASMVLGHFFTRSSLRCFSSSRSFSSCCCLDV
mmetsp:Transcript_105566/g.182008  ORF Transcript_105566/g.182008 Transcript_105566/m.182008 type:complete len:214 (+) Transcript_105566:1991-2632(+)